MRSLLHRSVILASCLSVGVVWSGCEGKQATEYVTGISTQVTVPRDLKAVRVEVSVGGVPQFCRGYRVYDGKVQLPRSLGTFAQTEGAITSGPITYTIAGLMADDIENPFFAACTQARVKSDDVRILRRSRQPYIRDEILFLPMPLKYSCYDKTCEDTDGVEMTCKGGKCVPATLTDQEVAALPKYTPDLVDGTGATCFSVKACMTPPLPATLVDPTNCTYAVPGTASAPPATVIPGVPPVEIPNTGEGVNVKVAYDVGLVHEILDGDKQEGFFIPDAQFPQRFRLAEGLCEMVKGKDDKGNPTAHRITAVYANGRCQPKQVAQPLCAADQLASMGLDPSGTIPTPGPSPVCNVSALTSAPAAMVVVVDKTEGHRAFFSGLLKNEIDKTGDDGGESAIGFAINRLLSDPVFQSTKVGLVYAQGDDKCETPTDPIPLGPAEVSRDEILKQLKALGGGALDTGVPSFSSALPTAYALLNSESQAFRSAVVVLGNRSLDQASCTKPETPVQLATAACGATSNPYCVGTDSTKTFVMQLTKRTPEVTDPPQAPERLADSANALAAAGGTGVAAYTTIGPLPGEVGPPGAIEKFKDVTNWLATCVYDIAPDAPLPGDGDFVAFTDPIDSGATTTKALFHNECSKADVEGEGFGTDGKSRIFLCRATCDKYRTFLNKAAAYSLTTDQPPISVPLYAYKTSCSK